MNNTVKIALGGLVAALCTVCMLITNIFPYGTFWLPAVAGMLLVIIAIEFGFKWAMLVFSAVSLLSVFFTSDKEAALAFILFLGFYPTVKGKIECLKNRIIQWLVKLLVFNVCAATEIAFAWLVLNLPLEVPGSWGALFPVFLIIGGNAVFIMYDIGITGMISRYLKQLRRYLFKNSVQ